MPNNYYHFTIKSFLGLVHLWSLTDIVIFKVGTLIYRLHRRPVVLFVTLLFTRRGRSFLPASRTSIFGYTARADHIIAWSRHQRSMRNYSRTCDRYGILLYISKYSCNIISTLKKSQYQITSKGIPCSSAYCFFFKSCSCCFRKASFV